MRRIFWLVMALSVPACRQEMASQPSYRPLHASSFFADGRSARPIVEGTVARDSELSSGMRSMTTDDWAALVGLVGTLPQSTLGAASRTAGWTPYRDAIPLDVNQQTLKRGQERFNIFCAICHDRVGTGNGMVVQRGFTAPPSFHTDWSRGFERRHIQLKLREAPVGYYFEVISRGFGAMPDYAEQIEPNDRWAIVAYVRVLQFSQNAKLGDIQDENEKARLLRSADNSAGAAKKVGQP